MSRRTRSVACAWLVSAAWVVPGLAESRLATRVAERIDAFVAAEASDAGIPGLALAVVQDGTIAHVRGFGHDGRGAAITGDTPFPIGSLTKSFTALLARQLIEAGSIELDAPVRHYLPWFATSDPQSSGRITIRHLLNQTSGLRRGDGNALLRQRDDLPNEELVRRIGTVTLHHPPGATYEYSNLNYVLLGALLHAASGRPWADLVTVRVLRPLGMSHSYTDFVEARRHGMTEVHRLWFGHAVATSLQLSPSLAPAGGLAASARDLARYMTALLDTGPASRFATLLSQDGVSRLLAPAARDARWHLGSLPSFVAWMVLLPGTHSGVVVLINANSGLSLPGSNAVFSRIPIGVVNLLQGQSPTGRGRSS